MTKPSATKKTLTMHSLIIACFVFAFSVSISAQTLVVGIDPTLDAPSPSFVTSTSGEQKKRFSKIQYQRVEGEDLHEVWRQLITIIGDESRIALRYEPSSSQLDFELKLAKGYYDLAYMSPIQFVNTNKQGLYKALAKRKSQPAKGLVVARKNGAITNLRDFEGKVIAFPGLLNFSGSIIPRQSLEQLNIKVKPHFVGSALQALQSVLDGAVLGAAGTQASLAQLPPPQREQLFIVWDTPSFTPHAFARHTRIPFYSQIRLQKALVGLAKTVTGKQLLSVAHIKNGFETATDSDWSDVAQIDISELNSKPAYALDDAMQEPPNSEPL